MNFATLSRMIENLIRLGKIEEIDLSGKTCRVRTGELLTNWLPWITARAGTTRTWNPPTVGEQVLVFSPSGELGAGIVLTGLFSTDNPAPSESAAEHIIDYPDGARIAYNHATHALSATGIQTALVQASQSVTADTPLFHCTGDATVAGSLTVDGLLTYKGGMAGSGGGTGGDAVIEGDVVIGGISYLGHEHPDAQGGTTGAPQ